MGWGWGGGCECPTHPAFASRIPHTRFACLFPLPGQACPVIFERDLEGRAGSQASMDPSGGEVELQPVGRPATVGPPASALCFGDRVLVRCDVGAASCYLTASEGAGARVEWLGNTGSKLRFRLALPGLGKTSSGATNDRPWAFIVVGGPIGTPVHVPIAAGAEVRVCVRGGLLHVGRW